MQHIKLQPKQLGIVYFDSNPRNAQIYVDGQILVDPDTEESLRTPTRVLLYEGRRNFTYVLEGHEDVSGYVDIYPGVTVNIFRNMKPGKSEEGWGEPEPQIWLSNKINHVGTNMNKGNVTVTSNPSGAKIYVDNVLIKETTPTKLSLDPGQHYIIMEIDGYFKDYGYVYIYPGSELMMQGTLIKIPYSSMSEISMRKYIKTYFMSGEIKPNIVSMQGPTTGWLVITTYPAGATVEMDGKTVIDIDTKETLKTPVQMEIEMGLHNLIYKLPGYCTAFDSIYIYPGGTQYSHKDFNIC